MYCLVPVVGLYNLKILCISAYAHLCFQRQQQQPAVFSEKAPIILPHTETDTLSGVGGDQVKINMTSNNCCSMSVGK